MVWRINLQVAMYRGVWGKSLTSLVWAEEFLHKAADIEAQSDTSILSHNLPYRLREHAYLKYIRGVSFLSVGQLLQNL